MSVSSLDQIQKTATSAAIEICWRQWAALGAPAAASEPAAKSIIDPEALLFLTWAIAPHERRLHDMSAWWARVGSRYSSLARVRAYSDRFSDEVGDGIREFASLACAAGDLRWKRLATDSTGTTPREKGRDVPRLHSDVALMLRMRAAFGLGIKADLLAVLTGLRGEPATVQTLVHATGYSEPALRAAARDMSIARLIRETDARPVRYLADFRLQLPFGWSTASDSETGRATHPEASPGPVWVFWMDLCAFLCDTIQETALVADALASDYVTSSRLRDLYQRHLPAFERNQLRVPHAADYPGAEFLEAFRATLETTAMWISRTL